MEYVFRGQGQASPLESGPSSKCGASIHRPRVEAEGEALAVSYARMLI